MPYKLGKLPKRHDHRTLKLANYLTGALPPPPESVDWGKAVTRYGMLANDQLGDCVIAGMMHLVMAWRANAGLSAVLPTDAETIAAYEIIGAYNPADPSTDQGCCMLDAAKYWRTNGITVGGQNHKILAFAEVNVKNPDELKAALWLFGGLFAGWALPASAEGESSWIAPPEYPHGKGEPGSYGGHCAPLIAQDSAGMSRVITWGGMLAVDWPFVADYCEEAYAVLTQDWVEANGDSPCGFNLSALQVDLAAL